MDPLTTSVIFITRKMHNTPTKKEDQMLKDSKEKGISFLCSKSRCKESDEGKQMQIKHKI